MNRLLCLVLVAALCVFGCGTNPDTEKKEAATSAPKMAATNPEVPAKWTATEGIDTPESVYVDSASGFIFSSQIVGMPGDRDGNGRIVKMSSDGKVVDANWVKGLNAPKGLRSYNGKLWTADIDEVIGIDIATAKIGPRIKIEGAQFLNDVATGADGTVYVTDMMANKIYAIKNDKASVFAEGEDLEYPNGLLAESDRLVVGGWGKPEADFTTKVPGHLFTLDLKTKKKTLITPNPTANIDGLESDGKGGYIATDYIAGKLLHITSNGDVQTLKQFKPGTADIAFVPAGNLAIIPHMNENKIAAYDLSQ
jgi:outer membrane protein assembly factor BamB